MLLSLLARVDTLEVQGLLSLTTNFSTQKYNIGCKTAILSLPLNHLQVFSGVAATFFFALFSHHFVLPNKLLEPMSKRGKQNKTHY